MRKSILKFRSFVQIIMFLIWIRYKTLKNLQNFDLKIDIQAEDITITLKIINQKNT